MSERDELINQVWKAKVALGKANERIAALEAERDALRADAARYRWLRDQDDSGEIFCMYGSNGAWGECGHMEIYGDLLDSEIDGYIAAIAAKGAKS